MAALPGELSPILQDDPRTVKTSLYEISIAIRKNWSDAHGEAGMPLEYMAEVLACAFIPDRGSKDDSYFGPFFENKDEHGGAVHEWPSEKDVNQAVLSYWCRRADEAEQPRLKARYADLVWDLSARAGCGRPSVAMARAAIDGYLVAAALKDVERREAVTMVERALSLAMAIRDAARVKDAHDGILELDRRFAPDENGAGIAFDLLVTNKKVPLAEQDRKRLIEGQERALEQSVILAESPAGAYPFSSERAALRLARLYRATGEHQDVQRVMGLYARAFLAMAPRAAGMVGAAWLGQVHQILIDFGCSGEAEAVAIKLRELDAKAVQELMTYEHKMEIPDDQMRAWVEQMLGGSREEALGHIIREFIPDPTRAEKAVRDLAKTSVLTSLMDVNLVDTDGRKMASVGPIHEDLPGRLLHHMAETMQLEAAFLRHILKAFASRYGLTAEGVLKELQQSPIWDPQREELLRRGVEACVAGDHVVAAHLLIPQIEHMLRRLMQMAGGSVYRLDARSKATHLRLLDDLLRDQRLDHILSSRVTTYLRLLLSDSRGWNLRNDVCHGMARPQEFVWGTSDRLLHIVLLLGSLRAAPTERESDPSAPTAEGI